MQSEQDNTSKTKLDGVTLFYQISTNDILIPEY
jgi:hypothetical protein